MRKLTSYNVATYTDFMTEGDIQMFIEKNNDYYKLCHAPYRYL